MPTPASELANADIASVSKDALVDVSGINLDKTIPQHKRAAFILATVKNPYCFRVGDMGVQLEFPDNAPPLQDVFTAFLIRQKSGLQHFGQAVPKCR